MSENAAPGNTGPENPVAENAVRQSPVPPAAVGGNTVAGDAAPGTRVPGRGSLPPALGMSLYAAMLGETGRPLAWLLEGMMTAQVASVLARLGIADELADGPLTATQLALRVGAAPDALSRLLSAAAVYGLVRKDAAGRFALTPASDLLRTAADGSARGVAVGFLAPPLWQSAGRLAEIVRNPEPVNPP